jgi:hypothetical protein
LLARRKWSKLAKVERKKLYTLGLKAMAIIILQLRVNRLGLGTIAPTLEANWVLGTGLARIYGLDLEGQQPPTHLAARVNTKLPTPR